MYRQSYNTEDGTPLNATFQESADKGKVCKYHERHRENQRSFEQSRIAACLDNRVSACANVPVFGQTWYLEENGKRNEAPRYDRGQTIMRGRHLCFVWVSRRPK
jgi:hypothetical protein